MNTPLPPIYRDCRLLLIHTEMMVRQFSRYHKYTVGTDLRRAAMTVMRTVTYAVRDKPHQATKTPDGSVVTAIQTGWLRHGTRRRTVVHWKGVLCPEIGEWK